MLDAEEGQLTLVLRNDTGEIDRLSRAVDDYCEAQAVPSDAAFHLNLVLEELVTNIVNYAYAPHAGEREIEVRLSRGPDGVAVELVDDGREFDPLTAVEPDLDASIEERPIGGLGVHFLRTLMSDVRYDRRDGRNHISFRKPLAGSPAGGE